MEPLEERRLLAVNRIDAPEEFKEVSHRLLIIDDGLPLGDNRRAKDSLNGWT
jgi:hypothetical protein